MKYIVMECHGNYAVLLDEQAGFVKAVNAGYAVGDTIEDPKLIRNVKSHGAVIMKITKFAAAAAACLAVVLGIGYYNQYVDDYSYVTISFDSDVKMALNRQGEVLSLAGLNEDGELLIDGYDPDRKDKTTVSDELIDRAVEMGMITDGDTITFEIDTPDKALSEKYGAELQSNALEHTKQLDKVEVVIRKPEAAVQTQTTEVTEQKPAASAATTISAPAAAATSSSTAASETVTTTVTRRHHFPSIWDGEHIKRPSVWDDDDKDENVGFKDSERDEDDVTGADTGTDTDTGNDGDDRDADNRNDHNDTDIDHDINIRDQHDSDDDSESRYDKDGIAFHEADSTEEATEASGYFIRSRREDGSDIEEASDTSENDDSIESGVEAEDEALTDTTEN